MTEMFTAAEKRLLVLCLQAVRCAPNGPWA